MCKWMGEQRLGRIVMEQVVRAKRIGCCEGPLSFTSGNNTAHKRILMSSESYFYELNHC